MEYNTKLYAALKKIADKNEELQAALETTGDDFQRAKEIQIQLKATEKIAAGFHRYATTLNHLKEATEILEHEGDPELRELAQMELDQAKEDLPKLEEEMKILLLPEDANNGKDVIIEMRPAAGGDEASIFVADLFDTYKRYITNKGWKLKILEMDPQPHGFNFISFSVSGDDVYARLKFESGVHRVQRVPATEAKGRIHTSTITVAVLPEQDDVEIQINPSDLRIDTYRASGAGGQHVNRTESAVRITHLPTGIVAACQEGKSQIENRETAMRMLRTKLWDMEQQKKAQELSSLRKGQVGTGDRSEKIRTYNYPQNRVTDHRIGLTINQLDLIMMGDLDKIIDNLIAEEQATLMQELSF